MRDAIGADEELDTATGEVRRREVPIGDLPPEPADLRDPYAFPFPNLHDLAIGNVGGVSQRVDLPQLADHWAAVPDPDGTRSLVGLARPADPPPSESHGKPPSFGQSTGPAAGSPVDEHINASVFRPPTEDEILGAAASGISGPMAAIWDQWKDCTRCPLHKTRKQVVLGSGNVKPTFVFAAQAPGPHEDQQGGPLVGPAGQMLTQVLNDVEINRVTECYLMNTVCCRPIDPTTQRVCPPTFEEIRACRPRFAQQFKALVDAKSVKVIVLMGKEAYIDFFFKSEIEDGDFNMESFRVREHLGWQDMRRRDVPADFPKVYFTYHPSYILRNGGTASPEYPAWKQDFRAIKRWAADELLIKPRGQPYLA